MDNPSDNMEIEVFKILNTGFPAGLPKEFPAKNANILDQMKILNKETKKAPMKEPETAEEHKTTGEIDESSWETTEQSSSSDVHKISPQPVIPETTAKIEEPQIVEETGTDVEPVIEERIEVEVEVEAESETEIDTEEPEIIQPSQPSQPSDEHQPDEAQSPAEPEDVLTEIKTEIETEIETEEAAKDEPEQEAETETEAEIGEETEIETETETEIEIEIEIEELPEDDPVPSFIGIDIGGTFTDAVIFQEGSLRVLKTATNHENPAGAVMELIKKFRKRNFTLTHGSTLATNAVLERKGEPTAFFATSGFKDMLTIGRQVRPRLYDLEQDGRIPLIPENLCYDVIERTDFMGDILTPLRKTQVKEYLEDLIEKKIRSLSVCLLFSYKNPDHERDIKIAAEGLPLFVSLSSEVLPQYREYERASTTTLNAYVSPILHRYISMLENRLDSAGCNGFRIMESNGGILPASEASSMGVRTLLSGPAGGVAGAFATGLNSGYPNVITLDMGGTSTDVALCEGEIGETTEGEIDGFPIALPMVDIVTIGAGGGSIARVDEGGVLKVGPHSAGADPGPACYGKGEDPTVTDAHLVLGTLSAKDFLGGEFKVDRDRAIKAVSGIAEKLNLTPEQAAAGIIKIAISHMERAMRVVTLERGKDPAGFTLIPFGGAGPVHAPFLAENLGINRILIPRHPGVLSAMGMLLCDYRLDFSQSLLKLWDRISEKEYFDTMQALYDRTVEHLDANSFQSVTFHHSYDVRYQGQSFEITIKGESTECPGEDGKFSLPQIPSFQKDAIIEAFHNAHHQRYGFARENEPVEIVNFRLKMTGVTDKPMMEEKPLCDESPAEAFLEEREITTLEGDSLKVPVFDRERLKPGNVLTAPAIVVQYDTTIFIPHTWNARIDGFDNIILE